MKNTYERVVSGSQVTTKDNFKTPPNTWGFLFPINTTPSCSLSLNLKKEFLEKIIPFSPPVYLWNMRYTISENRLTKIFDSYMDSVYNLSYDENDNERIGGVYIRDNGGKVFGMIVYNRFYHTNDSMADILYGMFGEHSYQLMLEYLNKKFPSLNIESLG